MQPAVTYVHVSSLVCKFASLACRLSHPSGSLLTLSTSCAASQIENLRRGARRGNLFPRPPACQKPFLTSENRPHAACGRLLWNAAGKRLPCGKIHARLTARDGSDARRRLRRDESARTGRPDNRFLQSAPPAGRGKSRKAPWCWSCPEGCICRFRG